MNTISMKLQADELIRLALQEDISSEDVTTNSVMKEAVEGEVQLICKQDGIVAGLDVFKRVFELLDENTKTEFLCKDGDAVKKGQLMGTVTGDIRVLLSGERVALLSSAYEWNRHLHTYSFCSFKRNKDKAFRYKKDNT